MSSASDKSQSAGPRAIVLLHGRSINAAMWEPQRAALAGEFRIVTPDLPGFGATSLSGDPASWRIADFAEHLSVRLGKSAAISVLVGFSLGGLIALELVVSNRVSPGALVLAGVRAEPDSALVKGARLAELDALVGGETQPISPDWPAALLGPDPDPAAVGVARRALDQSRAGAVAAVAAIAERPDRRRSLPTIGIPTFIVHGASDQIVPVEVGERLHVSSPGSQLYVVPRAGHLVSVEAPELFNTVIREAAKASGQA
jgi:pimeloyl-ACP methyl ester carboxylesterase